MRASVARGVCWLVFVYLSAPALGQQGPNLLEDPSFEVPKKRDQFGLVFAKWGGWKYEGDCGFAVGQVARTGKHSCLLVGGAGAKIRTGQLRDLEPGRYQITAYLRGLDIGTGVWNATTEFMFDGKYMQLNKNGTFGWTKLTYVAEVKEKKQAGPSFGMFAPGYFWIDDVSPDGRLIPAIHFEQLREGLDDYRRLLTAARLAKERAGTPAARAAEKLIANRLAAFELGQRDHDALFGPDDWAEFRLRIGDAIEALRR